MTRPLSLLVLRLNKSKSLSLSQYARSFSPLTISITHHWTCSSTSMTLPMWSPKLNTVLQMWSHNCGIERNKHFPWPACYIVANTALLCPWSPSTQKQIAESPRSPAHFLQSCILSCQLPACIAAQDSSVTDGGLRICLNEACVISPVCWGPSEWQF